jgi:hypothetical protein
MSGRRRTSAVLAGLLLLTLAGPARSQPPSVPQQPLIMEGRVLWIDSGSQTLALVPAGGGLPVMFDLRRIDQSHYQRLGANEYLRIVGSVQRPSRRIQAFELYLVTPWYPFDPQSP